MLYNFHLNLDFKVFLSVLHVSCFEPYSRAIFINQDQSIYLEFVQYYREKEEKNEGEIKVHTHLKRNQPAPSNRGRSTLDLGRDRFCKYSICKLVMFCYPTQVLLARRKAKQTAVVI